MLDESFVVIDFETSGLSPATGDRITEVGAVRIQGNQIVDRFESLANSGVRLDPFITAYTGITQRMVDTAPPVREVIIQLARFIGSSPVVAHNAGFDQKFFHNECALTRVSSSTALFICSLRLSRRTFPQFNSHALGNIASSLGITFTGSAHRAAADAYVTAHLLIRIAGEIKSRHSRLTVDAQLLRKLMQMPVAQTQSKLQKMSMRAA